MFNINQLVKKPMHWVVKATGLFALAAFFVISMPLFTQEDFNPDSVRPKGCEEGVYNCGMNVMPQASYRALPVSAETMVSHRGLPSRVDWSSKMPPVSSQGQQSSCVAWASAYAMKSYVEQVERNWGYDAPIRGGRGGHIFSPAYVYNQINRGRDSGSYIHEALGLMVSRGAATWQTMPYSDKNYTKSPTASAHQEAANYKNQSYRSVPAYNASALKSELAKGNLIVFGMPIDQGFYNYRGGVYSATSGRNYGGHAMTLVGYDDSKGAFKLINSWGTNWGENGYGWISYSMWQRLNPQAYVAYDVKSTTTDNTDTNVTKPEQEEEDSDENPQAPGNVSASKGTYKDRVVLSWNQVNGVIAYAVGRAPATNPEDFDYLGYSTTTSYSDTKVQPGIAYKYVILSVNELKKVSDPENATIVEGYAASDNVQTTPDQVVGLDASESGGRVSLSWSSSAGSNSYNIYRTTNLGTGMTKIGSSRSTSYTDNSPVRNAENFYAVSAVNGSGEGGMSVTSSVSIGGSATPPGKPSSLTATRGTYKAKIELNWSAVTGADEYVIYRYDYSSAQWQGPKITSNTSFTDDDSSVLNGAWFSYAVAAKNSAGKGDYSDYAYGKTNPNSQRGGSPIAPPKNLSIVVNDKAQSLTIKWDKVKGSDEYYVFRSTKDSDYEFLAKATANQSSYTDKKIEKGKLYFYIVRSKVLMGESEDSKPVAGSVNLIKEAPRHRSMPGAGSDKMTGTWSGYMTMDNGRSVLYQIVVKESNGKFSAQIKEGSKNLGSYNGPYAAHASSIVARNFKMELLSDVDNSAIADFKAGRTDMTLALTREKQ